MGNDHAVGNTEIVVALLSALECRERLTSGHAEKVAVYAMMIADRMGLRRREREELRYAALLHDIGKIGIPTEILTKRGHLTPSEERVMRTHPVVAKNILRPIGRLKGVIPAVLHHHERFDGRGYPDGLKGKQIPLAARIIAVADAFETMTNPRLYRRRLPVARALEILRKEKGRQFDPEVVDAFMASMEKRPKRP